MGDLQAGTADRVGRVVRSPYGEFVGIVRQDHWRYVQVEWDDGDMTWSRADLLHWTEEYADAF